MKTECTHNGYDLTYSFILLKNKIILYFIKENMKKIGDITFSNSSQIEVLEDACYWAYKKVIEDVKSGRKISEKALEHNFKRVIDQLKKMDLLDK